MNKVELPVDDSIYKRIASLLLIGPTGSGKTPFGDFLEKRGVGGKRCVHFDFGCQLRTVANGDQPPAGFDLEEYSFIKKVLGGGLLLENEHFHLAGKILDSFSRSRNFGQDDIMVLNGLPRHEGQARDMDVIVEVRALIVLDCSPEEVYERIRNNSGGDRGERDDDGIGLVRKKIEIYRNRTEPLIKYYAGAGREVFRVKVGGSSTAEDVYREFLAVTDHATL